MGKKLYVGNLPYTTTEEDLKAKFSEIGAVESAAVITDKFSGRSKGFGFVEMVNAEDAQKAIEAYNQKLDMGGRMLTVNEARPKEDRPRSFGGGNGGGYKKDFGGGY